MKRREFITLVGGAGVVWPFAVRAQQSKVPTIGVLVVGVPGSETFWRLFQEALRDLGYVGGQTVRFELRSDQGEVGRLPELAAELVRSKVDVIVTWFTPAAVAAKQATREIPIVMAVAGDPVANGLVESLSRPGGNVTGMSGWARNCRAKPLNSFETCCRQRAAWRRLPMRLIHFRNPFSNKSSLLQALWRYK
jgi:putative ABC transport system substrate-binding protein